MERPGEKHKIARNNHFSQTPPGLRIVTRHKKSKREAIDQEEARGRINSIKRGKRMNFSGKTAVITGAASGLGAEVAKAFAEAGANVALIDLNEQGVLAKEKELSGNG